MKSKVASTKLLRDVLSVSVLSIKQRYGNNQSWTSQAKWALLFNYFSSSPVYCHCVFVCVWHVDILSLFYSMQPILLTKSEDYNEHRRTNNDICFIKKRIKDPYHRWKRGIEQASESKFLISNHLFFSYMFFMPSSFFLVILYLWSCLVCRHIFVFFLFLEVLILLKIILPILLKTNAYTCASSKTQHE